MIQGILLFSTGLIFFIFGLNNLTTTVQKNFTNFRIRQTFKLSVKNPLYGVLTGITSTILFQSSSATTVLMVGLVSAGLLSFYHSLGILLGAGIGTTLTVQLVVWKITEISPAIIVLGFIMWVSGKGKWKAFGNAVFYFGVIFFGLNLVSQATAPIKEGQLFIQYFQGAENPIFGLLTALVVTAIIQTSSVPIAVVVILAQQNLVTIETSLPIVLGANLGTCTTALIASLGSNIDGKRSAVSNFLFKLSGVLICLATLPFLTGLLKMLSVNVAQQIVFGHFMFNALVAVLFLPFLKPFSHMVEKVMPGKGEIIPLWPEFLDENVLSNAKIALDSVRKEVTRELRLAQKMYTESINLICEFKGVGLRDVRYIEEVVDNLRKEIIKYLGRIPKESLSPALSRQIFLFSSIADDIERIADHTINLAERAERKYKGKLIFTGTSQTDLKDIEGLVYKNIGDAISLLEKRNEETIQNILKREDIIDSKVNVAREKNMECFLMRDGNDFVGPMFVEVLLNLKRISDLCENIAEYMREVTDS